MRQKKPVPPIRIERCVLTAPGDDSPVYVEGYSKNIGSVSVQVDLHNRCLFATVYGPHELDSLIECLQNARDALAMEL